MKAEQQPVSVWSEVASPADQPQALRNRHLLDAGGLLALRLAFGGLSFILTIILARALGTEGLGIYSYAFAWTVLLAVPATFGMDQLLTREVAALSTNSQWPLMRGLLRMTTWSTVLTSLSLAVVGSALIWFLRERWTTNVVLTFWVSLLLLPLISLTRVRQGALQGLRRVVLGSIPERLIQPVLLLALIGAAYWKLHHLTAPLAMGLNVTAALVAFVIGARWLHKAVPSSVRNADAAYRSSVWMRSAFSMLMVSSVSVVFSQADLLILGALKGATTVGLYSVADRGADMLTMLMVAQNGAFASTAAALYAARDLERLQRLATKIARWNLIVAVPPTAIFVLFGHWILLYVYGTEFTSARQALAILSLGQFVNIAMGLNTLLLMMTGHESRAAVALFAGATVNILLNLLLVPGWGMEGAAIGNVCSIVCWNILATLSLRRVTGIRSTVFAATGRVSA